MSIYVDKVHIYCDHENCDNNVMIDDEEMGSNDLANSCRTMDVHHNGSIADAISDYAFNRGWVIDTNGWNKVSCPAHVDND